MGAVRHRGSYSTVLHMDTTSSLKFVVVCEKSAAIDRFKAEADAPPARLQLLLLKMELMMGLRNLRR